MAQFGSSAHRALYRRTGPPVPATFRAGQGGAQPGDAGVRSAAASEGCAFAALARRRRARAAARTRRTVAHCSALMRPDFHILIIGGGMVGACAAALAAGDRRLADLRIAVLEGQPPTTPPDDDVDLRVSALSRASERILDCAGAWSLIPQAHRCAYTEMKVWDEGAKPH